MNLRQTIHKWIKKGEHIKLDALPFEELQNRYQDDPRKYYEEFIRRLYKLVFCAAEDFLRRQGSVLNQESIGELQMSVFEEFAPEFAIGAPEMLLVRFANAIKRVLDKTAFDKIARFYYRLLPAYYLSNDNERRFLVAAFQAALGDRDGRTIDEALAERFETPAIEVASILTSANRHLAQIMEKEFEASDLSQATEGYLQ